MALKGGPNKSRISSGSKDIKKSSYYVWFLGAQEAKGLRGEEYVKPIVRHLIQKERDVEPFKVTLQVSHKGLKIIQNVTSTGKNGTTSGDIVKHFIPHHAVTCVVQESAPNDDIVSCILLIYNPITRCPVHVHCYRCDSVETASILRSQLQTLIDRPDNQQKFNEIESRLQAKGLLGTNRRVPTGGSDGRSSSTRESESSGSSDRGGERIATLYDSLAAELREKLHGERGPILLPPRDYDTVHRQRGNLTGIELRRCRNSNIVGTTPPGSSGGSSGIGSDDAPPSPAEHHLHAPPRGKTGGVHHLHQDNHRHHRVDNKVTPATRYMVEERSSSDEEDEWREPSPPTPLQPPIHSHHHPRTPTSWAPQRISNSPPAHEMSLPRPRRVPSFSAETPERRRRDPEHRQRSPSPLSPRERFQDAKEKFHALERERLDELQGQLERRRQETAAANVAALMSAKHVTRRTEDAGRYRAVPTNVNNNSDLDEFDTEELHSRSRRSMYDNMPDSRRNGHQESRRSIDQDPRRSMDDSRREEPRRSMEDPRRCKYENIEDERRRNSHELAREFKRKSHQTPGYQELAAHERYPGLDKDTARLQHHAEKETARLQHQESGRLQDARYRHSYAEPEMHQYYRQQQQQQHRRLGPSHSNAGSSIASSGRLPIAAVHPY